MEESSSSPSRVITPEEIEEVMARESKYLCLVHDHKTFQRLMKHFQAAKDIQDGGGDAHRDIVEGIMDSAQAYLLEILKIEGSNFQPVKVSFVHYEFQSDRYLIRLFGLMPDGRYEACEFRYETLYVPSGELIH